MKERVLLLTDIFPCKKYSGGILSQQLSQFLLDEKYLLFCVCIKYKGLVFEYIDDEIETKVKTIYLEKPEENIGDFKLYKKKLKVIINKTLRFIDENKIDVVWCPIQGETLLRVLNEIQDKRKKIRIIPQIWDPIRWGFYELKYSKEKTNELLNMYDKVIKQSHGVLTSSNPMNSAYQKKYNNNCKTTYLSFSIEKEEYNLNKKSNEFVILMAGQPYASLGIGCLLNSLDSIGWKYKNKKIVFRIFGNPTYYNFKDDPRIDFRGYVPQSTLIEEQKKADLLYCSYFFENHEVFEEVSHLSYPSKVTSYIPSGVPILIHSFNDTSIYKHFEKYKAGYLLNSLNSGDIITTIKNIINNQGTTKEKKVVKNTYKLFKETFSVEQNRKNFFDILGLSYRKDSPIRILELNNEDLQGRRFNGYDIMEKLNKKDVFSINQLVTYKKSNNNNVLKIYKSDKEQALEYLLLDFEAKYMSVHSCLSTSSPHILSSEIFKKSQVVHLHLIHNLKLSLISLIEICNKKPTIISIHDPWIFTGRCVHYEECKKYMTGCNNCPNLSSPFPLKKDNCSELWNLKKYVYDHIDVDYVVSSKYMYDLFKNSPLTSGKRVHLIPFGIDINYFSKDISHEEALKRYNIPKDNIVLFHRAQNEFKGTNYVVEALNMLNTKKKITIITCTTKGLLDSLKDRYQVIDLGDINSEEMKYAYNACDIFLMPSIGESFGLMAVEAMSCSKPVIVFNNTALPSVVNAPTCGIAVDNKNSKKLMEAIKYLVEDKKERIKRGKLSRKLVEDKYDEKKYIKKIEKLYLSALKRKHDFTNSTILNNKIENNKNVRYMKYILNKLTKQIFNKKSKEYNNLIFKRKEILNPRNKKIQYSNLSVQLLLNEYNNKLIGEYDNYNPELYTINYLDKFKIYRMMRRLIYLLINDRKQIPKITKRKVSNLKKALKKKK